MAMSQTFYVCSSLQFSTLKYNEATITLYNHEFTVKNKELGKTIKICSLQQFLVNIHISINIVCFTLLKLSIPISLKLLK